MKKILFLSSIVVLLSSCGGNFNYHELIGSQERVVWNPTVPYGMVFVPQGSFIMGPSDQDVPFANVSTNQRVSVGAFYMDETEITNNEYRQFVEWVQDSILRTSMNQFQMDRNDTLRIKSKIGDTSRVIDWASRLPDTSQQVYDSIFVKAWVDGKEVKNKEAYIYVYEEVDYRSLSADRVNDPIGVDKLSPEDFREKYVIKNEIMIYPNTLDFQGDYVYSHEETEAEYNFTHEAYDEYPVIGIDWNQANAFCHWRTHILNQFLASHNEPLVPDFRLPTETEWEYAARGGLDQSPYPWGGPSTRNARGCFLANFKPMRGNYSADGGHKAIKVQQYNPNNYGLYDMAGNVSEWTSTVFDETSGSYTNDMDGDNSNLGGNFNINGENGPIQRKVIRGGSWKDVAYFVQTSTRNYEYANESSSYIGFRCVMDFLGRDLKDFK
ncbi:MAG: SUMF1/EgtB/PvdO family nonheme iron enzyme [Flavobacteriales bacterium]|nr:SUMF1/EgtB/PvdO family nonheme iron enzyme [Flavobacteriales bacterium]